MLVIDLYPFLDDASTLHTIQSTLAHAGIKISSFELDHTLAEDLQDSNGATVDPKLAGVQE